MGAPSPVAALTGAHSALNFLMDLVHFWDLVYFWVHWQNPSLSQRQMGHLSPVAALTGAHSALNFLLDLVHFWHLAVDHLLQRRRPPPSTKGGHSFGAGSARDGSCVARASHGCITFVLLRRNCQNQQMLPPCRRSRGQINKPYTIIGSRSWQVPFRQFLFFLSRLHSWWCPLHSAVDLPQAQREVTHYEPGAPVTASCGCGAGLPWLLA